MAQQIQIRNGVAAAWTSANPILAVGELAIESDTRKFKIGNGSTAWASLPYATQGETGLTGLTGKGLQYAWNGTQLGVRVEGDVSYTYIDLIGPPGIQGVPGADGLAVVRDNLTTQSATDALSANQGYILNNLVSTIPKNLGGGAIINGNFAINQRAVSGTVSLGAGDYGHDRFRGGVSGCTYTFATVENTTTLTVSAGSLQQEVEGMNLESGTHVLSWVGTAQGQIDSGGYGDTGITATLTGGTNSIVEFGTGTLSKVKLEKGSVATDFIPKTYAEESRDCHRYYWKGLAPQNGERFKYGQTGGGTNVANIIFFPTQMRIAPTLNIIGGSYTNCTYAGVQSVDGLSFVHGVSITSSGEFRSYGATYTADAEL